MPANVTSIPDFGKRLKARREAIHKTATEIADASGISLGNYCNLEECRSLPSLPVYRQICRALGVTSGQLLRK